MVPTPPFAISESLFFSLGLLPMEGSPSPFQELRLCSQTARLYSAASISQVFQTRYLRVSLTFLI